MTRTPTDAVLDWLTRLVALDTTSRHSNLPAVGLLGDHARALGLEPLVFPAADGTKANLVVTVPAADGDRAGGVLLSGHSDCVPVDGQDWASDPFTLDVRDGRAYGRGTADMKGFLALMAAALPGVAKVEGEDQRARTALAGDLVGQRFEPVDPAGAERQIMAARRHQACEFRADAVGRARDERQ